MSSAGGSEQDNILEPSGGAYCRRFVSLLDERALWSYQYDSFARAKTVEILTVDKLNVFHIISQHKWYAIEI